MCSHYQALKDQAHLKRHFDAYPAEPESKSDMWPGYLGSFLRQHPHADVGDEAVPPTEHLSGLFGLVPHWAQDTKITKHTFNCRSETAAEKPSFRDAWRKSQHCVIPVEAIYEPDWRTGKAMTTRIVRVDGAPFGIAGLWSSWKSDEGEVIYSFTMLTINADTHPLMQNFHQSTHEKRMVVVLPPERYQDWLQAKPDQSMAFLKPFPADAFASHGVDKAPRTSAVATKSTSAFV